MGFVDNVRLRVARAIAPKPQAAAPAAGNRRVAKPGGGSRNYLQPGLGFGGSNFGLANAMEAPYEAASMHESIPRVGNLGPVSASGYQPIMVALSRHQDRNDALFRRMIDKMATATVGAEGPQPVSEYEDLADLFSAWWEGGHVDSRGQKGGAQWMREDVARPSFLDGEQFVRRRVSLTPAALAGGMTGPQLFDTLRFQALSCDFCPVSWNMPGPDGSQILAGIEFNGVNPDQRDAYWLYQQFPGDYPRSNLQTLLPMRVPVSEVLHVHSSPMPGSPRGEVRTAAALIMSMKAAIYRDGELTRKGIANRFAAFIKETAATAGESQITGRTSESVIDELMGMLSLDPGQIYRLPPGMEMQFAVPPSTPESDSWYMDSVYTYICAVFGMPVYELTGQIEGLSDRAMKFLAMTFLQAVKCERDRLNNQAMNRIWRSFVDWAVVVGLWTPPDPSAIWRAYRIQWRWPIMITSQINQELAAMVQSVQAGFVDNDTVSQSYFGLSSRTVIRNQARFQAARAANGYGPTQDGMPGLWTPETSPLAAKIAAQVAATEAASYDGAAALPLPGGD